jgi:hypothetical protein
MVVARCVFLQSKFSLSNNESVCIGMQERLITDFFVFCLVWLSAGLAVRMGPNLGLHSDSSEDSVKRKYLVEELEMSRRVWGVTIILNLFLSL